jgi:hypothetical protein
MNTAKTISNHFYRLRESLSAGAGLFRPYPEGILLTEFSFCFYWKGALHAPITI